MEHFYEYQVLRAENLSHECFACGLDNESGLKTRFFATKEGHMLAIVEPREVFQSYPNRMHGGIAATILDECIGRAINLTSDDWGVTISLDLSYRKPVPLDETLYCRSQIVKDGTRSFEGIGEIVLSDGSVAVQAYGRFLRQSLAQITGDESQPEIGVGEALVKDPRPLPATIKFPTKTGLEFARRR